jgi:hypothetical protein
MDTHFGLRIEDVTGETYAVVLSGEVDGDGFIENLFYGSFDECMEYVSNI